MARSQLRHTVLDSAGNVIQNALCYVYLEGTTTAVSDLYAASSGGSPITTLTSNAQGEIVGYMDTPKRVDIKVTDNSDGAYYPSNVNNKQSWTDFTETLEVYGTGPYVPLARTIDTQTGDYTLALTDADAVVRMNVASANTLTVPANAAVAFPIGTYIEVLQVGAGLTTIAAAGGVTINSTNGLIMWGQHAKAVLIKTLTDTWNCVHIGASQPDLGFPFTGDPRFVSTTSSTGAVNRAWYMRTLTSGTISKIGLEIAVSSGNICVGVYANTGAGLSALPGARMATSGSVASPGTGWQEVALSGGSIFVPAGAWMALAADNTSFTAARFGGFDDNIGRGLCCRQDTAFPLPNPAATLTPSEQRQFVLVGVP